jgi:hypothetical protein
VLEFGVRVTNGSDTWLQEYDTMVAPLVVAKLDEPINVTVSPAVTDEEGETVATATGARRFRNGRILYGFTVPF